MRALRVYSLIIDAIELFLSLLETKLFFTPRAPLIANLRPLIMEINLMFFLFLFLKIGEEKWSGRLREGIE